MKHPIITLLLYIYGALTLLFVGSPPADAFSRSQAKAATPNAEYACIVEKNVFFYAAPDETRGLFLLPESYYVKLLTYEADYCRVEYGEDSPTSQALVGYVKTDSLTFVDYVPKIPYFRHEFELRYQIEDGQGGDAFLNTITFTCAYYGDYNVGSKTYCYVLRGDTFGYVPKPTELTVPENPEYAEYLAQKDAADDEPAQTQESTSSPAQIAILVALCLLVPLLAALILKPPRRPPYETE